MRTRVLLAGFAALLAARAGAQPFPARSGELGIIDVPDAEIAGRGRSYLAAELRFDRVAGGPNDFGPLPAYGLIGLLDAADLGFSMREWGQPGDPRPAKMLFGAAAKLQLWQPRAGVPGMAVSTVLDRVNDATVVSGRIAMSTASLPVRLAGFAGVEYGTGADGKTGVSGGLAAAVPLTERLRIEAEALIGPRGRNYGAALRVGLTRNTGISLGANYLPGDEGLRVALTFAFWPSRAAGQATGAPPPAAPEPAPSQKLAFADARPRFRLRIPTRGARQLGVPAHAQYGPAAPRASAAAAQAKPLPGARAAAPSLDDLAEAHLRDQEALADTREQRIRSAGEQLDAREKAALEGQQRLADRERELAGREQQLDARVRTIPAKGPPAQQLRQLESLEAQLASQERNLAAQERSYGPALDAAQGRATDAAAREEAERQAASRLAASVTGASSRALQLDIRKQANAARNRQLAAYEARLVAKGEYVDALEQQLRRKAERLDAWSRRLDTLTGRLDLLERLRAEPKAPPARTKPGGTTAALTPKDRAAFVMVVKSPTALVKQRPSAPGAPVPAPALRTGVEAEKTVAAATVLIFPTPASQLSELDVEALTDIAQQAARDRCELLVWARAKDPASMPEAQRRATDIQTRAIAAGPLDANQVVTRITVRPGAKGVDVVVSALRETAQPAAAPAAPPLPKLLPGESGNRQLREVVQAAQGSIEACVVELLEAKRLPRAEGVLKLTIGTAGRVTRITTGPGEISGAPVDECLGEASKQWLFPSADGEYVVDVPITVLRGGAR